MSLSSFDSLSTPGSCVMSSSRPSRARHAPSAVAGVLPSGLAPPPEAEAAAAAAAIACEAAAEDEEESLAKLV